MAKCRGLTRNYMSLRAWARSRGLPSSTAHKAAQTGRISRRADGSVDPHVADREWRATTRPGIGRRAETPGNSTPLDPEEVRLLGLLDKVRDPEWCGEPGEMAVSVSVAEAVDFCSALFLFHAQAEMVDLLAPVLAKLDSEKEIHDALTDALWDAARLAEARWQHHLAQPDRMMRTKSR